MSKRTRIALRCGIAIAAMTLAFNVARAQFLYGTLTGNVTDPANAVVPKAQVEAVDQNTNVKHNTESDDHGIYRFTDLQPGVYQVSVSAPSFKKFIVTSVQLQA